MNTQEIKARRLTQDEVEKLGPNDEILVCADMDVVPGTGAYVPAHLTAPGSAFEGGFFEVRTIFGSVEKLGTTDDEWGIWVLDKNSDTTVPVVQSAGLFMHLGLFVPDSDAEGLYKLYAAIRDIFGEGTVQKWSEEVALVPDAQVDVFHVSTRGRKGADGPKKERAAVGVYPQRARSLPVPDGQKVELALHEPLVADVPTI